MPLKSHILLLMSATILSSVVSQDFCSTDGSKSSHSKCTCSWSTDPEKLVPIRTADCARSNLEQFPEQTPLEITTLDLSHNGIEQLFTDGKQTNSSAITTVILSHNQISKIETNFLHSILPNLEKLSMDHNKLTTLHEQIFQNLNHLQYLDLSHNRIESLPNGIFTPLTSLLHIDLSYNDKNLSQVFLSSKYALSQLGVRSNVTSIELNNLGLEKLDPKFFDNFTNIKHLSLADNGLETPPSLPYSLEYLDLSGSYFPRLQAKYFNYHSLKVLKLDRLRKLVSVDQYAFYNLAMLEDLSMMDSELVEFDELIFGPLVIRMNTTLKRIDLSKNILKSLNPTYRFLFEKMELVNLDENPWDCNCGLLWLQDFHYLTNIKCYSPSVVADKSISDIRAEDLPDCHPEKFGKKSHRILIPILVVLVVILCGFIGYLIYYVPRVYPNGARIGHESPYNLARTEDS